MDGKQIQEITAAGILYRDDAGQVQFINFESCYQNYLRRVTSPEYVERIRQLNNFDDEALQKSIERSKAWKEIGTRNVLEPPWAEGPFIEFHTEPRVRFKFISVEEFRTVNEAIWGAGWQTTDLS